MRARKVVIRKAGGYEQLHLEEVNQDSPGIGEVRVATEAIGVNYADCVIRMGLYASAKEYVGWPITPGFEFAGHVDAVGPGVEDLAPGARVFGVTRFGGYATHVTVPRHQVFTLPARLSMEQAAGFPTVFLTAYYALFELAHPRPGANVLVHSAAGGVGGALLQLGRIAGCRMVGVVGGTHKVETARAQGAEVVIDKSREDLWSVAKKAAPRGYDVVLDANGPSTLRDSYKHLASPGKLVIYGFHSMLPRTGGRPNYAKLAWDWLRTPRFDPLTLTNDNTSVLAFNLSYLFEQRAVLEESMAQLLGWLEEGKLVPPPVKSFPLDAVADAHRALESGGTVGKLVLVP
ncbi:oxidoreductase, zinc-binding dehydrogenase family [Myxococcus xanthus DK 1622]|uniref:Oxidoreductase, zinc-binding dehydrogenase family n=2 Tax=Myxococcus xanthus TaxID=34 RepID=Q1DFR9_MYXXD|nr:MULTISPECIES: medium chain dehydrogenase/reductase family protein [Myxococcus]ABF87627.1 oxidoreductase, zinc-binding dehydrogenase family [Myxococcus xanthus DK 1622]QPM79950.1 zinc-binding dehydrogenase [Myxococcus xanthus]QVW69014.1 zinc-binding dehydrogenase [Myxococcus xanthus DZ2]QZZ47783.1 2-haloacrylate reductase [Myxococcus xanthus]UEO04859.1 medium chain dehydrogenase/reductase family protein [Myxococcus xanthus DZ2]